MEDRVAGARAQCAGDVPVVQFPREAEQIDRLIQRLRQLVTTTSDVSIVRAPLRISPLGAHIDHQLGIVTGFTIDQSILMAFVPTDDGSVYIESLNFEQPARFATQDVPDYRQGDWANYARGAALALCKQNRLNRGLLGVIGGTMPIGGLSSSAAVTLAYLLAFEAVNQLMVDEATNVQHCRYTENHYIGLNNGILDQSVILYSAPNHLTRIDCHSVKVDRILYGAKVTSSDKAPPTSAQYEWREQRPFRATSPASPQRTPLPYEVLVVYSGITRGLPGTDYNSRVEECQMAARKLLERAGETAQANVRLRHVHPEIYDRHHKALDPPLQRRAAHFFGEMQRVHDGIEAWRSGDVVQFGSLMNQSGASSIENYECGSPHLITLYEILSSTPGVYGTRFSGAGFRGNCIALIDPTQREAIASAIHKHFPSSHPDVADKYSIHFCRTAGPATLLTKWPQSGIKSSADADGPEMERRS